MHLYLVREEQNTKLECMLEHLANKHHWELNRSDIFSATEGLQFSSTNKQGRQDHIPQLAFETKAVALIHVQNPHTFEAFVAAYRQALFKLPNFTAIHLLSDTYQDDFAIQIADLSTLRYLVAPDTEQQLETFLLRITGSIGNAQDHVASILQSEFGQVIDYSAIISMTDAKGTITYANNNFCRISGYSREELIGQSHALLKSGRHVNSKYQTLWTQINRGEPWHGYFCNRSKSGQEYWVDSVIYPILSVHGEVVSHISVRYDVTREMQLKARLVESDKRFRLSHRFANIGSWDWNLLDNTLHWSDDIHHLFGYDHPLEDNRFDTFLELVHADDRALVKNRISESINQGTDYKVEHRVVFPNGEVRWLSQRGKLLRDQDGKATRLLGVVTDIDDLKQAQEKSHAAERLKSAFISTLSHEIRNPLNALAGYNRLLADLSSSSEQENYSEKISNIVAHITGILDDINLNTRLESGNITLDPVPSDLSSIVSDSLAMLSRPEKHVEIQVDRISEWVLAERRHLMQVIVNLVSNACKYNREYGKVMIRSQLTDANTVRLEIIDTGHGIAEEKLSKIFQPYQRLNWSKSEVDGLGLGLSICKLLIQGMRGKIGVESTPGKGSLFWIELPKTVASPAQQQEPQTPKAPQTLPKRVLVLEDNAFNQEFMREQLSKLQIHPTVVNNGLEGLNALENDTYDAVITDLNMPKMGGIEFIKALRSHRNVTLRNLSVIIISADNSGGERYQAAYQTGFLVKPFSLNDLTNALAKKFVSNTSIIEAGDTSGAEILDMQTMLHYLGEDSEARARLLRIYRDDLDKAISSLERHKHCGATETPDENLLKALLSISHRLSSASLSVGAQTLARDFKQLEDALRNKASEARIHQQVQRLLNGCLQVRPIITSISAAHSSADAVVAIKQNDALVSILVIDDDEFAIAQITEKLTDMSSLSFEAEMDAEQALKRLEHEHFDIIILDIDMPNIDGIQFIRLFEPLYRQQGLVIYSGEKSLISPVAELTQNYGMHYLGVLEKPSTKLGIYRLISRFRKQGLHNPIGQHYEASMIDDDTIRACVEQGKICVLYQPQIEVHSSQVVSVEALSRLKGSDGQLIPPIAFLSRLEALGLERSFAIQVACIAIKQLAAWLQDGHNLKVAINFSMPALEDITLPDLLKNTCQDHKVASNRVVIEVTETALSSQPKLALEVLVRLKLLGFVLSIDDFGTGYSSLDKLQKLPFTEMKLDRSYVSTACQDEVSHALLTSSLGLAQQLKMQAVAEGIESLTDYRLIASSGAQFAQGFYFAKPLLPTQLIQWKESFNHDSSEYF